MSRGKQDLSKEAAAGERAAFAQILEHHQRAITGFLRARVSRVSDVDDLTQEVFLRCYEARARFDSGAQIRPWLLGIARNVLREWARSMRRRKEVGWTELCLDLEALTQTGSHDIEADVLESLPECLEQLGPSAKQAIELKYRSDQRFSEIGTSLRRSEGAVKLLVHRARLALRQCLQQRIKRL